MKYNYKIHNLSHVLKAVIGPFISIDFFESKDQLIVLNFHGTQKKFINNFIKQINYLSKHYEIISPSMFFELINSEKQIKGKKMLLTFDDGIKNNQYAIDELDKRNISAFFFVVPEFIETTDERQKEYFVKNIRPVVNPFLDKEFEDFSALSWEALIGISKRHSIGCHTFSHTMVKDILSDDELKKEIITSKEIIACKIGLPINSFCSINNTSVTIGKKEKQLVEQNYQYHFTTFGGNNINVDPFVIKRINIESHWLIGAVKFALSSLEFKRWNKKISNFKKNTK